MLWISTHNQLVYYHHIDDGILIIGIVKNKMRNTTIPLFWCVQHNPFYVYCAWCKWWFIILFVSVLRTKSLNVVSLKDDGCWKKKMRLRPCSAEFCEIVAHSEAFRKLKHKQKLNKHSTRYIGIQSLQR